MRSGRARKTGIALLVLALICGAGVWLLGRESTLIFAVGELSKHLDGRLQAVDVHGSLLGTIRVRELRYEDRFGRLAIDDAHLEWRPLRLLLGQVAVGAMAGNTVTLEPAPSDEEPRKPPASLSAPIAFAVTDFRIGTLRIVRSDATQEIHDLRAAFSGSRRHLDGVVKSLATQYGNITGEIKVGAQSPFPLDGHIELRAPDPQIYSVAAKLGGTLLDAEAALDATAREATATAKIAYAPFEPQPLTRLEFVAKDVNPQAWTASAPRAKLYAEAQVTSDAARTLQGRFAFANGEPGTLDDGRMPLAAMSGTIEGTPDDLALRGIAIDLTGAGRFDGDGAWRDRVLQVALDTRNLNLQGLQKSLRATRLAGRISADVDAAVQRVRLNLAQQEYRFRFAGAISDGIASIEDAYARAGGAELATRGRVALDEQKAFSLAGRLQNFDPARFGAYPQQRINGRFDVKGSVYPVLQVAANVNMTDSRLYGLPATAHGTVRSRRTDHPDVAMDVVLRVGDTEATARGVIRDPAELRALDMQLTLAGASLAELYKIVGVPLPPTPRYRIRGRLMHSEQVWEFRQFAGAVGDSDLEGDFLIDRSRTPQFMKASIKSNHLALADLAGFIGAEKTAGGKVTTRNPNRVLPDTPYNLEKLKAANADIRFEGRQIVTERLPVSDMRTHLVLKDGVLTLSPLDFGAAGGKLVSEIMLDGRNSVITSRADIRVQSLQLGQLLPQLKVSKASVGEMDGRIRMTARGNSIAAMLGSANGETALVVGEGEVSDLMLRLSNLDLANALLVLMRGDRNVPIRCMVADLAFENGVMRPRPFVFDTAHTTLVGEGTANFADETLNLRMVATPRDNSLLSLRGPINVSGTFSQPSALPDLRRLSGRGAIAAGLAVLATPLAAIVPFIQVGRDEPVQCGPLLQAARMKISEPATRVAAR